MKKIVLLGDSILERNPTTKYENRAVGGYSTLDLRKLLEQDKNISGDIAVVAIGVNDILANFNDSYTRNNIFRIINILKERFDKIIFVSGLPTDGTINNDKIRELNTFISEIPDIDFLNIHNAVAKDGFISKSLVIDGVHLNKYGFDIYNNKLDKFLANYL